MNKISNKIKRLQNKHLLLNIGMLVLVLIPSVFAWFVFKPLIVLGGIVIVVLIPFIKQNNEIVRNMKRVRSEMHIDLNKALKTIQSEVNYYDGIVNAPKTEMDVHAFNATNEGKAMKAASNNLASYMKILGVYKDIEQDLLALVNEENQKIKATTIDFDL